MAATYTPIASITLGTAASSVTFSSIPQTYTDLVIVINGATDADANLNIYMNGDTSSIYSETNLYGNGSTATSTRTSGSTNIGIGGISSGTDEQGTNILQIFNYSNTTTFKTTIARANNSTYVQVRTGLRRSTDAITSLTIVASGTTFLTGSTFNLYGIQAGNA
jgi:hypothetical protein